MRFKPLIAALLLPLLLVGCGQSDAPEEVTVVSAQGIVFSAGKPAAGAKVMLHPTSGPALAQNLFPQGSVDQSGNFSLTTYRQNDGAPAGDYKMTITWPDQTYVPKTPLEKEDIMLGAALPDKLRGRYNSPAKSNFVVTITSESGQVIPKVELP